MSRSGKGRILAGLVFLVILACMLPAGAMATGAMATGEQSELWVNGEDMLTAANYTIQCGGGSAVYDPATSTLTLKDATLDTLYITDAPILFQGMALTIVLEGNNEIICSDQGYFGIHSTAGSLTITGTGTLDIQSARSCIQAGEIVVDGAELHLKGQSGLFANTREMVLQNGAEVTLECMGNGNDGVYGETGVRVKDSKLEVSGSCEECFAVSSPTEIVFDHADVKAENTAANAKSVIKAPKIIITNASDVAATTGSASNAIYAPKELTIQGSKVEATSTLPNASPSIWAKSLALTDQSEVTASAIGATNVIYIKEQMNVEGSTLAVENQSPDAYPVLYSAGTVSVSAGSEVRATANAATNVIYAKDEITVRASTLTAANQSPDAYPVVYSKTNVTVLDHSTVTATSEGKSNVINAQGTLTIAGGSTVTAESKLPNASPAVYGKDIAIEDATLSAKCSDHYAVYADSSMTVKGDCEVTAYGGVYPGTGGLTLQPTGGEQLEVQASQQVGGHENLDDRYGTEDNLPGGMYYPYFHIGQHTHTRAAWEHSETQHWYTCPVCKNKVDTKAHAFDWTVTREPTDTATGLQEGTCGVCGYTATMSIPATGHSFDMTNWVSDASAHWHACTTPGCGGIAGRAAHTFQWITDKAATETDDGSRHEECTVCHYQKPYETISATGHSFDMTNWVSDASAHWHACTTPGCGGIAGRAAHTFQWVTDKAATETAPGSKHEQCTVCGYAKAAVAIPAHGGGKPSVPQTGDNAPLAQWLTLLLASGTALLLLAKRKPFHL